MTKSTFLDWDTTANNNTDVGGINIAEGCPPSNINNAIREAMAQLRAGVDGEVVYAAKATNYAALLTDNNAVLRFTAAATLSLTAVATLVANWHITVIADGGDVTIDPNGAETIDGAATFILANGSAVEIISNGSAFFTDKALSKVQPFATLASAATTDLSTVGSQNVTVTGTTTITSFGTAPAGTFRRLVFSGILTLTHNATSLILPNGGSNITTVAGDTLEAVSLGSGNWRVTDYTTALPIITTRAWVNFNGTGTVAIRASGNVSSITDNGTGDYTINFTTAMPDANYIVHVTAFSSGSTALFLAGASTYSQTTTAFRLAIRNQTTTLTDAEYIFVEVKR